MRHNPRNMSTAKSIAGPPPYKPVVVYECRPIFTALEVAKDRQRSMRSRCKIVSDLAKQLGVSLEPTPFFGKSSWLVGAISLIQAKGVGFCQVVGFRNSVKAYAKEATDYHTGVCLVAPLPRTAELCASYASPCQSPDVRTRIWHGVAAAYKWQYGNEFVALCKCTQKG